MNKLVYLIYRCAENTEFNNNSSSTLQIINVIAPIILTIITILLTVIIYINNSKLQKQISNRDIVNQTRQIILGIYDTYSNLLNELLIINGNVVFFFSSESNLSQLKDNLTKHLNVIQNSLKHLYLLVPNDNNLIDYLNSCNKAFIDLYNAVNNYISSQEPNQVINDAINRTNSEYNVNMRDYYGNVDNSIYQNAVMRENYLKYCSTRSTDNIQKYVDICISKLMNNEFNEKFKKHIQISEL